MVWIQLELSSEVVPDGIPTPGLEKCSLSTQKRGKSVQKMKILLQAESGNCSVVLLIPNVPLLFQPSEIATDVRFWAWLIPAGEEMPNSLQEDEMWE